MWIARTETKAQIQHELKKHGFGDTRTLDTSDSEVTVLIAKKIHPARDASQIGEISILLPTVTSEDMYGLSTLLQDRLSRLGAVVSPVTIDSLGDLADRSIISLLESEKALVHDLDDARFHTLQKLFSQSSRGGIWVKRGNAYIDGDSDPAFHASTGLLRVMRNEKQDSPYTELALARDLPLDRSEAVEHVVRTFIDDVSSSGERDQACETELAELHGVLYIPRLYDDTVSNRRLASIGKLMPAEQHVLSHAKRSLTLSIGNPDDLNTLRFLDDDQAGCRLADGEVSIEAKAHSVIAM
jgi:hypothetical protein